MKASELSTYGADQVVVIDRRSGGSVCGVVVAVGRKWLLVHTDDGGCSGGISALRCSDVTTVRIDHVAARRPGSGVGDGQPLAAIGLDTTAGTLARMSTYGAIVTVHLDDEVGGRVGTIVRVSPTKKRFEFLPLTGDAGGGEDRPPVRIRFSGLRRVDVAPDTRQERSDDDMVDGADPPDHGAVDEIELFRSVIGTDLAVSDVEGTPLTTLSLETVAEHHTTPGAPRARPFSLLFVGSETLELEQGSYDFTTQSGTSMAIFVVPVGPGPDGRHRYQADYN